MPDFSIISKIEYDIKNLYISIVKKRDNCVYKGIKKEIISSLEKNKKNKTMKRFIINLINKLFIGDLRIKKYIFVGLRYKDLLTALNKSNVLIVCRDKSEVLFAVKNNISFIYGGMISNNVIESSLKNINNNLILDVKKYYDILNKIPKNSFLILTSDTKPIDIFFLKISQKHCSNIKIICIQHGIFPILDPNVYVAEGENSPINLLYDEYQLNAAKRYIKNSNLIILGPPWNIEIIREKGPLKIVLVGAGGSQYHNTYDIFAILYNELRKLNINCVYKPHPTENKENIKLYFDNNSIEEKKYLLSNNPKIFIGINSTLMYEAFICGHTVYNLEFKDNLFNSSMILDESFEIINIHQLINKIKNIKFILRKNRENFYNQDLKNRFLETLNIIS